MKKLALLLLLAIMAITVSAQEMPIRSYYKMIDSIKQGWNTWDVRSMFTQLYLPESFSIKVALVDEDGTSADDLRVGNTREDAAIVHPHDHTFDGTYSEVDATWHGTSVKLRSASDGERLVMLITPLDNSIKTGKVHIRITPEYAWNFTNDITGKDYITLNDKETGTDFHFATRDGKYHMSGMVIGEGKATKENCFVCDATSPVLIYTGASMTVEEAEKLMQTRKAEFEKQQRASSGSSFDVFNAMQSILAWDTVYDPADDKIMSPVSRNWCLRWSVVDDFGGYVLFDWDTFFASQMMASSGSRELAYSNAFEVLSPVDRLGFVPKSSSDHHSYTSDCSQPPVGSMAVWRIYNHFHEKWFLELTFDRLLTWNRWWPQERETDGLLCWGSNPRHNRLGERWTGSRNSAVLESGLDNPQMYDGIDINPANNQLYLQDVGLTSLYVMDCDYLAKIAAEIGRDTEAKELTKRAEGYRKAIQRFWCDKDGMFYNIDTKTGEFNKRTSCTNFYVLLAKAATDKQAERIVREHMTNEDEFWGEWILPMASKKDPAYQEQNYWRGRIWGPTNFLVYMGLRNYNFPDVRKSYAEKSAKLLLKDWVERGCIYENWNAITGKGDDVSNSDWFYHWGALLGYISFMENQK